MPNVNTVNANLRKNANTNKPIARYTPGPNCVTSIEDEAFVIFMRV